MPFAEILFASGAGMQYFSFVFSGNFYTLVMVQQLGDILLRNDAIWKVLAAMSHMGKAFLINKDMYKYLVKRECKKVVPNICMTLHLYRSYLAFFNSVMIMANYL